MSVHVPRWEYQTFKAPIRRGSGSLLTPETALETLHSERGEEGWELVGVAPVQDEKGATVGILGVFKRPKG